MRVGILGGTGPLGRGLALRLAASGYDVVVGSRDAERAVSVVADVATAWPGRGLAIAGAGNEEAAAAETVVLATPWDAAVPTARALAGALDGKVVVSVANALVRQGREMQALVLPRGSVAAGVQAVLPGSAVAAAGHHLPAARLADLDDDLRADVLVCADDDGALEATVGLFGAVPGLRPLRAGSLASASAVEAFTAVLITMNMRYKAHSTLHIAGIDG
ncbi:MAG: NADPH-dependent F420 reductase [Acidobacteriota bacterium]|nr:NADPH-dependent F420 reductase [Acidobacteriota bacterium]